jgi:hypothetical protein
MTRIWRSDLPRRAAAYKQPGPPPAASTPLYLFRANKRGRVATVATASRAAPHLIDLVGVTCRQG